MKLLEYEAKQLLARYHLPIPKSQLITKKSPLTMPLPVVLKSQVLVGGRGKRGGVVVVATENQFNIAKQKLFALSIQDFLPTHLLAEENLSIISEHYLSLFVDRDTATVRLMAHKKGGVNVEANAASEFLNIPITTSTLTKCSSLLAHFLGYEPSTIKPFITNLFAALVKNDALLIEINPLIFTEKNLLVCGDCKIELDDTASFRHNWHFEAPSKNANFVTLNHKGNVATIANGAGLAMATVDAVAARGMTPANFLDIGGGATAESVFEALQKIKDFSHIRAIVVNIFAGITRCDQVAKAIIEAKTHIPSLPPLFIRLAGTNFEEARALLAEENIPTLTTLEECLELTIGAVNE